MDGGGFNGFTDYAPNSINVDVSGMAPDFLVDSPLPIGELIYGSLLAVQGLWGDHCSVFGMSRQEGWLLGLPAQPEGHSERSVSEVPEVNS